MEAEEIFKASVKVMKEILPAPEMNASIKRSRTRTAEENSGLLLKERENVNELVRKIAYGKDRELLKSAGTDLIDALVLRYLNNREVFMKTFPKGIEDIDPEPFSLWAAIMISPRDDAPVSPE
jgi:hypothetical protein